MCDACKDLQVDWPIRTAGELEQALRIAKQNVGDGTLVEETPGQLLGIADIGPWSDILQIRLRCRACRARFELSAETYHGTGGGWRPLGGEDAG